MSKVLVSCTPEQVAAVTEQLQQIGLPCEAKTDPWARQKQCNYRRYHEDEAFRLRQQASCKARSKQRYDEDPVYRVRQVARSNAYAKQRCAEDPGYHEKCLQNRRDAYQRAKAVKLVASGTAPEVAAATPEVAAPTPEVAAPDEAA
jgi:hypothetical protein